MSNLVGVSQAIVVKPGATGRCGPGTLPPTPPLPPGPTNPFDSFDDRTIALQASYLGWGEASSHLEPYTSNILDVPSGGGRNDTVIGVANGLGQLRSALGDGSGWNPTIDFANVFDFYGYWFVNSSSAEPAAPATYELRFRVNDPLPGRFTDANGDGAYTAFFVWELQSRVTLEVGISPYPPNTIGWDGLQRGGYVTAYGGGWGGDASEGDFVAKTDWASNTWYQLRASVTASRMQVWLWRPAIESRGSPILDTTYGTAGPLPSTQLQGLNVLAVGVDDGLRASWPISGGALLSDFSTLPDADRPQLSIDFDFLTWSPPYDVTP